VDIGQTLSAEAYRELRRRLLVGEYPLAERLTEVGLAGAIGTSRTPIREALLRLEAEGLVERRHHRGFYPRSPNLIGVRHLYQLRAILELQAIALPEAHGRTHDLERVEILRDEWVELAAAGPDPDAGFVVVDESFHVALAEAAGNPAVAEHLRMVNERIRIVRMQNFVHAERIRLTAEQHLGILDALLRRDPATAGTRLEAHLEEAEQQAAARAAQAIERMLTVGSLLTPGPPPRASMVGGNRAGAVTPPV